MQETELVLSVLRERGSRTRHKSLESPVPGKRARRVRREAARKRPASTRDTGPRCAAHPTPGRKHSSAADSHRPCAASTFRNRDSDTQSDEGTGDLPRGPPGDTGSSPHPPSPPLPPPPKQPKSSPGTLFSAQLNTRETPETGVETAPGRVPPLPEHLPPHIPTTTLRSARRHDRRYVPISAWSG
jgi:hypothetical protein